MRADLTRPLARQQPVDAILSVATPHWLPDHDVAFQNVAAVVRTGGQLVAECGGRGNIASVVRAIEQAGGSVGHWSFAGVEETRERLQRAGFQDIRVRLRPDPIQLRSGRQLESYLATVVLGANLHVLTDEERAAFTHSVAGRPPRPEIDYVRLEMQAVRGPV